MKPVRIPTAGWLCLLLGMEIFTGAETGLGAEVKFPVPTPQSVVWTLDNVTSVSGQKPEVLGAPKVVGTAAGGPALLFNGQSDALVVPVNPLAGWKTFTVEVLFLPETNGPAAQRFFYIIDDRNGRAAMETHSADGRSWCLDTYLMSYQSGVTNYLTLRDATRLHPNGQWTWAALVYDGKKMSHYVNGVKELQGQVALQPMTNGSVFIGVRFDRTYWFKGCIKELRFTPAALKPEALQRAQKN
ncbi:MAG: LamG-like jellyroll fold domain-containing protein [Verrucomicrobiota bacterium]